MGADLRPTYKKFDLEEAAKEYYTKALQSFQECFGGGKAPKRDDMALFSNDGNNWNERIFLADLGDQIIGRYVAVSEGEETKYHAGEQTHTFRWIHMESPPGRKLRDLGNNIYEI